MKTIPKFVGLNRCLSLMRMTNLLAIVMTAARTARPVEFVRSSRHRERPEIKALRGSKAGNFQIRVQAYWVRSATPSSSAARPPVISKSSQTVP
jgi:hypothetical protein